MHIQQGSEEEYGLPELEEVLKALQEKGEDADWNSLEFSLKKKVERLEGYLRSINYVGSGLLKTLQVCDICTLAGQARDSLLAEHELEVA